MTGIIRSATTRRNLMKAGLGAAVVGASWLTRSGAASAAGDIETLVAAAKAEGEVTIYHVLPEGPSKKIAETFTAKYGIKVNGTRLTDAPQYQRVQAEIAAGVPQVDVLENASANILFDANEKGWLAKIGDVPAVAGLPAGIATDYKVIDQIMPYGLAYNSKALPDGVPPKSWKDLADSKYKGLIGMSDPRGALSPTVWLYIMREKFGAEFLQALAKNVAFFPSGSTIAQQVASGALAVNAAAVPVFYVPLKASGAPVEFIFPEPTSGVETSLAIAAKARHPNAARLLVDFYLSPEGQAVINNGAATMVPGVKGTIPLPAGFTAQPDFKKVSASQDELYRLIGAN